jgi:NADP-dependent 3-hydroxy acid dehydrogenase YdfG
MKKLTDLVVVLTGASSGIGLESAKRFAEAGCKLAMLARSEERLNAAAESVRALGVEVLALPLDVTDESAVIQAFTTITEKLGPVDILVNNAGVGFSTDLSSCSLEDYRAIFETNVTGVFLCSRAVLPEMKSRKSGHIINVSSVVGKVTNPGAPLYCASKFALNGYTSGLQQQVAGDRIRVSTVSPSGVDTAYWDGRDVDRSKFLQPGEVAEAILFIASQPEGVLIKDMDLTALR